MSGVKMVEGERMSEKPDDYEVEVFVKDNKIIVIGKIRPIHLCVRPVYGCAYVDLCGCCTAPKIQYESCKYYVNEDNNLKS